MCDMEVKEIGNIIETGEWNSPQRGRIYSVFGLSPSIQTMSGGNLEPKIITEVTNGCNKQSRKYITDKDTG